MSSTQTSSAHAVIVETQLQFSLQEFGRACSVDVALLESLVLEGVLTPQGGAPEQWRFHGSMLPRARRAVRLMRDLELSAAGAALVLDLFDEMESLKSQLRRLRG